MAVAAKQRILRHLQQVKRQTPGAPAEQTPRVDLQPDGQFRQFFQLVTVRFAEAKPFGVYQHHLIPAVQHQRFHCFGLQAGPVGEGHFQHEGAGTLDAQGRQVLFLHVGEISYLRRRQHRGSSAVRTEDSRSRASARRSQNVSIPSR